MVTNAPLDAVQLTVLARMASAGIARTIYPAYTPFDGEAVFAFSTGDKDEINRATLAHVGSVSAHLAARTIVASQVQHEVTCLTKGTFNHPSGWLT